MHLAAMKREGDVLHGGEAAEREERVGARRRTLRQAGWPEPRRPRRRRRLRSRSCPPSIAFGVTETAPGRTISRRRPIFPKGCPLSIFGAGELDFRVRDGNGYGLSASVTRIRCVWTLFGCDRRGPKAGAGAVASIFEFVSWIDHDSQPLTPGQLLKRSSPRPLVPLSFIRHRTSTCGLSNRWSPCGLTRLTRWGTSSRGELRT